MDSVTTYIQNFPLDVQIRLNRMRTLIKEAVTEAEESFSYGMPAYKLKGKPLVYFAGYKQYIGFYATPQGHQAFAKDFADFKQGKGSVQFPLNKKLPEELILKIILFKSELILAGKK